ncbi:MAG: hypothetical protein Q8K36_05630 [Alphaproteobacteria bacterium]|nr:hypothetical protein [Alphaproteobacteria bacterium]
MKYIMLHSVYVVTKPHPFVVAALVATQENWGIEGASRDTGV